MALVEVIGVTKEFRKGEHKIKPLDEVSLEMERNDFVSLMGVSGSGKSTLLNQIAGIDTPTSGTIIVNGTKITKLSRMKLAHWRAANIGYIFMRDSFVIS